MLSAATVSALMLAASTSAATLTAEATLKVDQPGPKIDKYVYGQFSEHLGAGIYEGVWVGEGSKIPNVRGIRTDVVNALKEIKVPLIRWPGGCFADEYHWRDGIGPRDQRPSRKNNWWGGSPESNHFGTHEFFDFAEQVGADAYVSINVGSGDPTEMREWIEYMTSPGEDTLAQERRKNGRDKPFKVPVIGIGNESWGCGGSMTPEYYSNEYRRFNEFFHKGADNPALRIAVGPPSGGDDDNWTEVVMKQIGSGRMDGLSLHYYTLPTGQWEKKGASINFSRQAWVDTFSRTLKLEDFIVKHGAIMDKYDPEKKVALYVDEWGTWYDVEPGTNPGHLYQLNTLRDGVLAAVNFNFFHKHADRVKMTAVAQTINVLQAMILTKDDKILLTPTYYAFKMYVPFQDSTSLPLELNPPTFTSGDKTLPAINASAAKGKDGKTYIGLANMNPDDEVKLTVNLGTLKATKVSGEVLTAPKMDARNEMGVPATVVPVSYKGGKISGNKLTLNLPAKSVVVVKLD
ncbi:alpha-N-arabinofuranosidase [Asticcacaulis benevestitus]|uniref:non-reducing end alpha-L-arabinofuranosidase n=1 Tax=Asticcacaulis benevestitus DSM 16100 = ATCC BAA-896 TaxID=1121022 RepID=V4PEA1_9CAUL|nr:alpha-L-arabinofuranosidase [Asticcacaulis benevestitus DSM 16100 = ATCC BAA-896]